MIATIKTIYLLLGDKRVKLPFMAFLFLIISVLELFGVAILVSVLSVIVLGDESHLGVMQFSSPIFEAFGQQNSIGYLSVFIVITFTLRYSLLSGCLHT